MFTSENVPVILAKAVLVRGQNADGEATIEAECQIVLEPFREELAHELGDGIASHLFCEHTAAEPEKIRPELQTITLDPKVPRQKVTVSSTVDGSFISGAWRHVSFGALSITRVEKNSLTCLKAVQRISFDIAPKDHRELLIAKFGEILYLSFEAEQGDMFESVTDRVKAAIEDMRPKPGSGVTSVGIAVGDGPMTTLHSDGRTTVEDGKDELLSEAQRIVIESNQASISYLQRQLRIGFSRAARLIDQLEVSGVVSAAVDGKREVITPSAEGRA